LRDKFAENPQATVRLADALSQVNGQHCNIRSVVNSQYVVKKDITRDDFDALAHELGGVVVENN
jgi:hypothetical protein